MRRKLFRDPDSGALVEVNRTSVNEEDIKTSGLDVEVAYSLELDRRMEPPRGQPAHRACCITTSTSTRSRIGVSKDVPTLDGEIEYPTNRGDAELHVRVERPGRQLPGQLHRPGGRTPTTRTIRRT